MKRLPGSREVDKALKGLDQTLSAALTQINQRAAEVVRKSDYSSVESLVEAAKSVREFRAKVAGLRREWNAMQSTAQPAVNIGETAKAWEYFQPVLKGLLELGGSATRAALEEYLTSHPPDGLKEGDFALMAGGLPRWRVMVRRSRRALVKESFLQNEPGVWRLTPEGERAAESGVVRR